MKKHTPAVYKSPINLPEGRSGKVQITHKFIEGRTDIVSAREAYTRGIKPAYTILTKPLRVHELSEDDVGVWMTDMPIELNQAAEYLAEVNPRGDVLVGGLGLGIVAKWLTEMGGVTCITVVEKNPDIIKLCADPHYDAVEADILDFIQHTRRFDYYLLDTWQGTGECTWWDTVLPLRRAIRNTWDRQPRIHCWAEEIMQGQVGMCLAGPNRHWYYKNFPPCMTEKEIKEFFRDVGLPKWEKQYGPLLVTL